MTMESRVTFPELTEEVAIFAPESARDFRAVPLPDEPGKKQNWPIELVKRSWIMLDSDP